MDAVARLKTKKSSLGERGRGLWTLARKALTTVEHFARISHSSHASDRHHPSCEAEDRDVGLDDRRQEGASVYLRHGHRVRVALRPATSACVRESNRIESNRMRELMHCIALHCIALRRDDVTIRKEPRDDDGARGEERGFFRLTLVVRSV